MKRRLPVSRTPILNPFVDVDECADAAALSPPESLCENFGTCINTRGAYECKCIKGAFGFNCSESESFMPFFCDNVYVSDPDDCALSNEFVDEKYWPNRCISRVSLPTSFNGCRCTLSRIIIAKIHSEEPLIGQSDERVREMKSRIIHRENLNVEDHYFREPNCTDGFDEYTCNCSIYWTGEFCMTGERNGLCGNRKYISKR